jgi:hypothetical protein
MGHEPPPDDDGYEARALLIRQQVTFARDAVRRAGAQQAVEHAVRAATWIAELHMLDMTPDVLEAMRESIRLSAREQS